MRPLRTMPVTDVYETLRHHPTAVTRAELVALSSDARLRTALTRGEIVKLLPNAYVATEHAQSWTARADAALTWAGPGAMLTGRSALFAWTLLTEPPPVIDLIVPHDYQPRTPPWLKVCRVTYKIESISVAGLATAPLPFAIAQGYADMSEGERSDAVFGAIAQRMTTTQALRHALAVMPRVRLRRSLNARIAAAEEGAESWLEEHSLRTVFAHKDFDRFVRQHKVARESRRYRLDMYDPFTRTCVELDSYTWHSREEHRLRDIRRDADLAALGILTVRLASCDLTERPDWCRGIVREVVASRFNTQAPPGSQNR